MDNEKKLLELYYTGLEKWTKDSRKEHKKQSEERWDVFRISGIGECAAKITRDWATRTEEKIISNESKIRMFDGSHVHETSRFLLRKGGCNLSDDEREVSCKITGTYAHERVTVTLIGHMDNIWNTGKEKIVIDYKKSERFSYNRIEEDGLPDTYVAQMMGYLKCSGLTKGIVFIRGTHGKEKMYPVEFSEEAFKKMANRLAEIAIRRRDGRRGKREYVYGLPPCMWCPYQYPCWNKQIDEDTGDLLIVDDKKTAKLMKSGSSLIKTAIDCEKKAVSCKAEARKIALKISTIHNAKKVVVYGIGSLCWVSVSKNTLKVVDNDKAVAAGLAVWTPNNYQYPRFTGMSLKEERNNDD